MTPPTVSNAQARLSQILDGGFVGGVSVLALFALAPFQGTALFQGGLRQAAAALVYACLLIGILRALLAPNSVARACAVAAGLGIVYLSLLLDGWARSSAARGASALAYGLSAARFELPWMALLMAASMGALGVLQFFALRRLLQGWPDPAARIISLFLVVSCAALLLRAVIAYSSGSAWLFVAHGG